MTYISTPKNGIRNIVFILALWICSSTAFADQFVQLYVNNFNEGQTDFDLLSTEVGNGPGNTQWVINDKYNGDGIYPDTPDQNQTYQGNIGSAPHSQYLHTFNSTDPTHANTNYDVGENADIFAAMKEGVCTYALDKVRIVFFYIGSDDNSYLEVFYSKDQGPWTSTGQQYSGADKWKYIEIVDENYKDVEDLRFGFRFVSNGGTGTGMGIGIDDMQIVGEYDEDNPVTIEITSVPESICEGTTLPISFEISDTLCTGTYYIELSNSAGNFPPTAVWSTTLPYPLTQGSFNLGLPNFVPPGSCYKIRITRMTQPQIVGEASICFEIEDCDNTIVTNGPPLVLTDPDDPWVADSLLPSICTGSVIDVQFNSWGVFNPGNYYILQLSNPDGEWDFGTFWSNLGSVPDDNQYPSVPPGGVGGLIPDDVPEGCNYYLRVVSTFPGTVGEVWGPFCIRHCDIETNNKQDINVCITEYEGATATVNIDINVWTDLAEYFDDNDFLVELRDMMFFGLVSYGDWLKPRNEPGTFTMEIPKLPDLIANYDVQPGGYYMRIVGTSSSEMDDVWGTWIHLFIGAPAADPTQLSANPTELCIDGVACFSIVSPPANPNSTYDWFINGTLQGTWPGSFATRCWRFEQPGEYGVQVQETNYGCKGPLSPPVFVYVLEPPPSGIVGPDELCQGEEACFSVDFVADTYYHWELTGADIIGQGNDLICIKVQEDADTLEITLQTLNECGNGNGFKGVKILPAPKIENPGGQFACEGESITLDIVTDAQNYAFVHNGDTLSENTTPVTFTPTENSYYKIVGSTEGQCVREEAFPVVVMDMPEPEISGPTEWCEGDEVYIEVLNVGDFDILWSTNETTAQITPTQSGEYTVELIGKANGTNKECIVAATTNITILPRPELDLGDLVELCEGDVITLDALNPGASYIWSTSETTQTIEVSAAGIYSVEVDNGICVVTDNVEVVYSVGPAISIGEDVKACKGDTVLISVDVDGLEYKWNTGETTQTIQPLEDGLYIVEANNECGTSVDTVRVQFQRCSETCFLIPSAFTPNNDERNDSYRPYFDCDITNFTFQIYDRWGRVVYKTTDPEAGWDGMIGSKVAPLGVYVWWVKFDRVDYDELIPETYKGNVTLIR